jgi:hypothetical protein
VHGWDGGHAQGVALATPYGHPLVERIPLGGVQFGGAEEVGDLARHIEGDRRRERRRSCRPPPRGGARPCCPWPRRPAARLALEVALEFAGGGEGLHHELHGGQQLAGAGVAGGEVHGGERAVVDAQGETVAVEDVEHVEDVAGASDEAEHLGDVHGVSRPRVVQQFAELRPLERVETAGGPRVLLEDDRVLDPGLVQDEVLPGGRLLIGRDPLVDQVRPTGAFVRRIGAYLSSNPVSNHHRI